MEEATSSCYGHSIRVWFPIKNLAKSNKAVLGLCTIKRSRTSALVEGQLNYKLAYNIEQASTQVLMVM